MMNLLIPAILGAALLFLAVKHADLLGDHKALRGQLHLWQEQQVERASALQTLTIHRYPRVAKIQRPGGDVEIPADEFDIRMVVKHQTLCVQLDHDFDGKVIGGPTVRHMIDGDQFRFSRRIEDAPPELTWLSLSPSLLPLEPVANAPGG